MSREQDSSMAPVVEVVSVSREELDVQVTTAKRFKRNLPAVLDQIESMALRDEESALGCYYFKPRAGEYVEGLGIRFAELVLSHMGNMRIATRIAETSERAGKPTVIIDGVAWDLENNVQVTTQVMRTAYRAGKGIDWDTAVAAGTSFAIRNCVLRAFPRGYFTPMQRKLREKLLGDTRSLTELRNVCVRFLSSHGVKESNLAKFLADARGPKKVEDWTPKDILALRIGIAHCREEGRTAEGVGRALKMWFGLTPSSVSDSDEKTVAEAATNASDAAPATDGSAEDVVRSDVMEWLGSAEAAEAESVTDGMPTEVKDWSPGQWSIVHDRIANL